MSKKTNRRRQILIVGIFLILGIFTLTHSVLAQNEVLQGNSIDGSQTVQNDVFLNGDSIELNGTVVGDALAVGRTIVVNGNVQGSMFILAEDIVINGDIENSGYAIAVSLNTLADSTIGRSLYFLGVSLGTEREAQIGRDLTAVTLGARLAGEVERDTNAIIGIVEIGRILLDRINTLTTGKPIAAIGSPFVTSQAVGGQNLFAAGLGAAAPSSLAIQEGDEDQPENDALQWVVERLRDLVSLLLVGALVLWLIPKQIDDWAGQVRRKTLAAAGWGLVAYIFGFIGSAIIFLIVLVIGISFAAVTLWQLAWTWWFVMLSTLALTFALFILAVSYISKIIIAYLVGRLILERFGAQPNMRKPWPLLLGLTLYVLVCGIPFLGWAISLIVTFLGLGGMWLGYSAYRERANKIEQPIG